MCKKSSGSFSIEFNEEQDFKMFGHSFAKCYANFGSRGQFSRPSQSGDNSYSIEFSADCGCDSVIGKFNAAYKKTFGDKKTELRVLPHQELLFADGTSTAEQVPSAYSIALNSCSISNNEIYKPTDQFPEVSTLAVNSPTTSVNATAIDSQMNYAAPDIDKKFSEAVANVTLYSQAAARSVLQSKGIDISSSKYLTTEQWYDEVIAQMSDLGFIVHSASAGKVNKSTHSGEINLKDIVTTIVSAYIAGPELSEFENLAKLLTEDPDNTGVANFLDFWWNSASSHENNSQVAWGPVTVDQGSAEVTCIYMNIDVAFKDWRSLFVSFHSENVNIASTAITLTLDMEVYDKVKGDITSALGDQIKKHIKKQKLNFGS